MSFPRVAAILLLAIFGAVACGDSSPTVDASSAEETRSSLAMVKEELSESQQPDLDDALEIIARKATGKVMSADTVADNAVVRSLLNGKTGADIIADARRITRASQHEMNQELELLKAKKGRKTASRRRVLHEIEKLQSKLEEEKFDLLEKFEINGSWFGADRTRTGEVNTIELAVQNETAHVISRVRFRVLLITPNRKDPWIQSEFTHSASVGLKSGESDIWKLDLPRASDWIDPIDHDHTLVVARPIALNALGGRPLAGARFAESDRRRLRSLLDSIEFQGKEEVEKALADRNRKAGSWRRHASAASAKYERDYLQKKYDGDRDARASLARLVVTQPRLYFSKKRQSADPVLELTLHNDTEHALARFRALGVLTSHDRKTPWVEDHFSFRFKTALLPGVSRTLKLAPRTFSGWGRAPKRNDLSLDVSITRLEDPNGKSLYKTRCSDAEYRRLRTLKRMITKFGW
ncbi:MAG: DUF6694 family lipoprotein [Planctomycetota bacterium]